MSESSKLSIGEFGRLTWLSSKALRLYEQRGLLVPDYVDEYTGYRSYRPAQAERARTITLLRRVGMPLATIGEVLDAEEERRRELIKAYQAQAQRDHERAVALLEELASGSRDAAADHPLRVRTRQVKPQAFVSRTLRTTAADLPAHIERTASALARRAGSDVDRGRSLVVVYHGEVSWESDGPVEIRMPVRSRDAADGAEPEGTEFFVDVPYGEVQFPTILRSFDAVRDAAMLGGNRPSGSPREVYLDGDPFRCQVAQRYIPPVSVTQPRWKESECEPSSSRPPSRWERSSPLRGAPPQRRLLQPPPSQPHQRRRQRERMTVTALSALSRKHARPSPRR